MRELRCLHRLGLRRGDRGGPQGLGRLLRLNRRCGLLHRHGLRLGDDLGNGMQGLDGLRSLDGLRRLRARRRGGRAGVTRTPIEAPIATPSLPTARAFAW